MADHAAERTEIDASPEACFAVATDFARYTDWASDIKEVNIVALDDADRGGDVGFRVAAMGRSTSYTLRYSYGSNPLRMSWRLIEGDVMQRIDGEYEFVPIGDGTQCEVRYYVSVDMLVPLPGFVKRRAEAKILHTAMDDLKKRVESASL
ncbi:MAG: ribosome-associated toxin RatA of RatAB toxin-antitoxin module [Verrucomicrobiales bacterium]|jgi:ribosome-associated toxin RatA of RatAB toxin-antitoxin module